jgi:hypothetical protein
MQLCPYCCPVLGCRNRRRCSIVVDATVGTVPLEAATVVCREAVGATRKLLAASTTTTTGV